MDSGRERGCVGPRSTPLPASKTVFILSSLLVVCPLSARGKLKPEQEFHAGASFRLWYIPARTTHYVSARFLPGIYEYISWYILVIGGNEARPQYLQ